jgi:NitT/TauT family transport system substrate-binding protein
LVDAGGESGRRGLRCGPAQAAEEEAGGESEEKVRYTAKMNYKERKRKAKGRNKMKSFKIIVAVLGLVVPLAFGMTVASAEDQLKLAIGQINNWENQPPTLGQDAGIFKKHGLVLENVGTQGAGETIQAVISGSADIGAGVGAAGVMRAYSKGAPVRILAPAFTGTGDLYWYVKADSKIHSLKDTTAENTIAYSTNGSSSNNIVVAFVSELGAKAKPTATGGPPGTLTAVMSGQVDIGWAAPPFGIKEINEGKIRIVARGSDVPSLKGQTVRVLLVNAESWKTKHAAILRFMEAYREAVDWMYADPKAVEMYSAKVKLPVDLLKESMAKFQPKEALQSDTFADLDGAVHDAVKLKFLDKPLTKEQLSDLIVTPPRKK